MKTLKNILFLFAILLLTTPVFSQVKNYDKSYQEQMGKALDKLSPQQMQEVLEHAATMVEEENARKALACIANSLSKEDQDKLLRHAKTKKYSFSTAAEAVAPAAPPVEVPMGPITTIEFEKEIFDFGEIDEGEKVSHVYKFTNTGNEPLIIQNAKGTCGCTVPKWPKEPIPPGATGEMIIEFNSKGKGGIQNKRVTVTANTYPVKTYITIKGMVNRLQKQ